MMLCSQDGVSAVFSGATLDYERNYTAKRAAEQGET